MFMTDLFRALIEDQLRIMQYIVSSGAFLHRCVLLSAFGLYDQTIHSTVHTRIG